MKWNAISIQNQNGALGNLTQNSRSGRKGKDISQNAEQKSPKIEIEFLKERTVQETQHPNTRNSERKISQEEINKEIIQQSIPEVKDLSLSLNVQLNGKIEHTKHSAVVWRPCKLPRRRRVQKQRIRNENELRVPRKTLRARRQIEQYLQNSKRKEFPT